jgi:hypothetical protein
MATLLLPKYCLHHQSDTQSEVAERRKRRRNRSNQKSSNPSLNPKLKSIPPLDVTRYWRRSTDLVARGRRKGKEKPSKLVSLSSPRRRRSLRSTTMKTRLVSHLRRRSDSLVNVQLHLARRVTNLANLASFPNPETNNPLPLIIESNSSVNDKVRTNLLETPLPPKMKLHLFLPRANLALRKQPLLANQF